MMRVAVCVSGICHDNVDVAKCVSLLKAKFPNADFYYTTWSQYQSVFEQAFPNEHCVYFDEPAMHYHPYTDIPADQYVSPHQADNTIALRAYEFGEPMRHHTKQILSHFWLANTIKDKYDVIVKARYDLDISEQADFTSYVEDSFVNQRVHGFAGYMRNLDQLIEYEQITSNYYSTYLVDQLIIHPASLVDVELVTRLHEQKLLQGAEYGWYQVLSKPYDVNHQCWEGWVQKVGDHRIQTISTDVWMKGQEMIRRFKGYVVTLMDMPQSVESAKRCIESADKFGVNAMMFTAVPKATAMEQLKSEGLTLSKFDETYSNTPAVIGNFVSQYRIWKLIAASKDPAIVLEHDAVFTGRLPNMKGHIINLGKPSYGHFETKENPGIYPMFSKKGGYIPGAHGYYLTPVGAQQLINKAKEFGAAPCDLFLCKANFPDILELYPWVVEARDSFSTIQKEKGCLAKHNYNKKYTLL